LNPKLLEDITNAQHISNHLNQEIGSYGIKMLVSPYQKAVYIHNKLIYQLINFFEGKAAQPTITGQQVERVQTIIENAKDNKVDLLWLQTGFKNKYYLFKQYGYSLLNLDTVNSAGVALSATGSVALTIPTAIALSWSGGIFLSTLENVIPDSMVRTKAIIRGSKYIISFPIRIAEATTNGIIGFAEGRIIGNQLPINVKEDFRLTQGPKIEDLRKLKKPVKKLLLWLAGLIE